MDKNTIIGFVLIAALLIGFSWYTQPSEEDIAKQRMQDSITALAKKKPKKAVMLRHKPLIRMHKIM